MVDMFENFRNIPDNYTPNNKKSQPCNPRIPRKPLTVYDIYDNVIGYSWNYGDSVILEFTTTGEVTDDTNLTYMSVEEYFKGKKLELQLIDSRYNVVLSLEQEAQPTAKFEITTSDSEQLCRNVYMLKLLLIDDNNTYTLFDTNDAKIYIK